MSLVYTLPTSGSANLKRRSSLYIGGKADAKSLEKLQRWGVTHILNVTPAKDVSIKAGVPNYFEKTKTSFVYKRIGVYDIATSATELESQADSIVSFISRGLCHGSVLVHCQQGVSRSTTCAIFYLMRKVGLPLDEAMKMIHRRRPQANPIPAFWQVLKRYEKVCQAEESKGDEQDAPKSTGKRKRIGARPVGPTKAPSIGTQRSIGPSLPPPSTAASKEASGGKSESTRDKTLTSLEPTTIGPSLPKRVQTSKDQQ